MASIMRFQGTHLGAALAAVVHISCSNGVTASKSESDSANDGSMGGSGGTSQDTTKSASSGTPTSGDSGDSGGVGNTSTSSGSSGDSDGQTSTNSGSGGDGGSPETTSGVGGSSGAGTTGGNGSSTAKEVAAKLGRDHFLIGMGNDLADDHNQSGAYTLGTTLDLHYAYLVGLPGQGGWPDWNEGGWFVNILADTARNHGVVPMFTVYSMAAAGENNVASLTDPAYMGPYWEAARLLFERLADFGDPSIVHLEPDFWAFAQHAQANPEDLEVLVGSLVDECESEPDTVVGMGRCWVTLARQYAPEALVGFHASAWAGGTEDIVRYLRAIGSDSADLVVTDMLDRDAGCFEAGEDPNCQRTEGGWYWDETNQTSPNFHEHLEWARAISEGLGKPMMWWQVPFGVPSETPGGAAGHYRDNRVKYIFEHVDEFAAAGGVGAVFGVGAANQTYIDTDGDQFKNAVSKYFEDPYQL